MEEKEEEGKRSSGGEKEKYLLSAGSLTKRLQQLGLGQAEARSPQLSLSLPCEWQGPSHFSHCSYLQGILQQSWDLNPRILIRDVGIPNHILTAVIKQLTLTFLFRWRMCRKLERKRNSISLASNRKSCQLLVHQSNWGFSCWRKFSQYSSPESGLGGCSVVVLISSGYSQIPVMLEERRSVQGLKFIRWMY